MTPVKQLPTRNARPFRPQLMVVRHKVSTANNTKCAVTSSAQKDQVPAQFLTKAVLLSDGPAALLFLTSVLHLCLESTPVNALPTLYQYS